MDLIPQFEIWRIDRVTRVLGLSRSTVYNKVSRKSPYFDQTFPRPLKLGPSAVGWRSVDILTWIDNLRKEI